MFAALLIAAAAAAAAANAPTAAPETNQALPLPTPVSRVCESKNPDEIVVCGAPTDRYRMEPSVLQAIRSREAMPPKPEPRAGAAPAIAGCIGSHACKGDFVPRCSAGVSGA